MQKRFMTLTASAAMLGILILSLQVTQFYPSKTPEASAETIKYFTLIAKETNERHLSHLTSWTFNGTVPGPTIILREGEKAVITLVNTLQVNVSLHVHGVHYDIKSDGTCHTGSFAPPGGTYTYTWTAAPGTAGTWPYHDHVADGECHGAMKNGLYGALIVRAADEKPPDRDYVLVMIEESFNGKQWPNTPVLEARVGERVRFHVITLGTAFHTFHLHGHRWLERGTNVVVDTFTQGAGESRGFDVIAGEGVGPGDWMYHCHVHSHMKDGMIGIFRVVS